MKLRYEIVFKQGVRVIATIEGLEDMDADRLTPTDIVEKVLETEAFLEKLTGLRVHINQMEVK